jgi:AcrR family transcriptional regulator
MKVSKPAGTNSRGPGRPRDEEVRRRVLSAASNLLQEVGFRSVTVDAIAERAGASKATVYRWWPDKASVLIEAFREAVSPEFPFADTGSLCGDIKTQLRRFSKFLLGRRGRLLAAIVVGAQEDPEMAMALRDHWIRPLRKRGAAVLDRYRKNGELPPDTDLDLLQDMMYAPFYYNLLTGYTPISERYADTVTRAILDGIRHGSVKPKSTSKQTRLA